MKTSVSGILLVFAFVLFVLAALPYPANWSPWSPRLVAAGLACYMGSLLF